MLYSYHQYQYMKREDAAMQTQITAPIPLLNDAGELTQPGYAKSLLPVYRRATSRPTPSA